MLPKDLSFWSLKPEGVCLHPHVHLKASNVSEFSSVTASQMSEVGIFDLLVISFPLISH